MMRAAGVDGENYWGQTLEANFQDLPHRFKNKPGTFDFIRVTHSCGRTPRWYLKVVR
jgi:hypothetical protein